MKNKLRTILLAGFILILNYATAQIHISGFVKDLQTGEKLIGANVVETGTNNGTSTDNMGYFSIITLSESIQISFIGYKTDTLQLSSDTLIHISLESGKLIKEITITAEQMKKKFNVSSLSYQELSGLPMIGGKPDVMKALQLLPGIQSFQEGSSLLSVRGGNPGENLYLIDNIPLIYVNHLGGFMSVFNPEIINNIEVYKGGFPAKFGGKLSSIVAITQREGNKSKITSSFEIGLTDASFNIEGPLMQKKSSFIATGRKTLVDPLMILISGLATGNDFYLMYGFHDLNGKFSWQPDEKNSIYLNVYQGDDYIKYWNKKSKTSNEKSSLSNSWGNWLISARWNRILTPRLVNNNILSFTHYRSKIINSFNSTTSSDTTAYWNEYYSTVQDLSFRSDWQYKLMKNWSLDFGTKATYNNHIPNKISQSGQLNNFNYERINAKIISIYLSNRLSFYNTISGDAGVRIINYQSGKYNKLAIEPRISINTQITRTQTINLTFQKITQFAHLILTSGSIMNNDIWIPSDRNISPSNSTQFSIGWKSSILYNRYKAEVNLYYKTLNHLVTYKEGYSNLLGDSMWRSKIETDGSGSAKGIELLIRKNKGDWSGFFSYTYSNSNRRYPGINMGKEFLFDYDRPHSISFNISHKLNSKWLFNSVWVYQTGIPYTPVVGRQLTPVTDASENGEIEYTEAFIYGERNSSRMKIFHRLDIGMTLNKKNKQGKKVQWNFSVYNAYNRHNPASYYYGTNLEGEINDNYLNTYKPLSLYQISFFPIIPTISYKIFFE